MAETQQKRDHKTMQTELTVVAHTNTTDSAGGRCTFLAQHGPFSVRNLGGRAFGAHNGAKCGRERAQRTQLATRGAL
jgi:hypothetical protein